MSLKLQKWYIHTRGELKINNSEGTVEKIGEYPLDGHLGRCHKQYLQGPWRGVGNVYDTKLSAK